MEKKLAPPVETKTTRLAAREPNAVAGAAETYFKRWSPARLCNEAVEGVSSPLEKALLVEAAAAKIEELFDILHIDHVNDHNTRDTPRRVAKMLVNETLHGRYSEPPDITDFENAQEYDNLIVTGPIELRSTCAHHMMPIYGEVFVGILPAKDGKIIGLSKYDRIVDYFGCRLQIQEELVKQIGNFIVEKTEPRGLAVRISAVHMCKTHRGVRATHGSRMVNSAFYGELSGDRDLQNTFLHECIALGNL
jgi:GTP cyclohydrolase I